MSRLLPEGKRQTGTSKNFTKNRFFKLTEGMHTVRFLELPFMVKYYHYLNYSYIECLGDECPVCSYNQEILAQVDGDWEEAKKVKGFNPWSTKYYANVLDRTDVKVCPNCETENKANLEGVYTLACSECGSMIANVQKTPSNTIKILSGGKTLFEQDLVRIDETVTRPTGDALSHVVEDPVTGESVKVVEEVREPIGIENYDVSLRVVGSGRNRQTTPLPQEHRNDSIGELIEDQELHDLDKVLVRLTPVEIAELRQGVSLKDIFAARKAQANIQADEKQFEEAEEAEEEALNTVNELFNG